MKNEKCSSPLRAWEIWRQELLSVDLKSNHVPFSIAEVLCYYSYVSFIDYCPKIICPKIYYVEVKLSFILYVYVWHRRLLLLTSVTVSPSDPNSFSQATLTPMVKTALLLFTEIAFRSWTRNSCSQTQCKPIVKRLWLCARQSGQLQRSQGQHHFILLSSCWTLRVLLLVLAFHFL